MTLFTDQEAQLQPHRRRLRIGWLSVSLAVVVAVVISMVPALVVFVLGQRPLREGLTAGASK